MAQTSNIWAKRILIGLGGVVGLLLLAAIVVPLVVDVDQYRPQIIAAANQRLNGKLDIGKLSLSLWGQVEVDIDGIHLEDAQGNKIIGVDETYAQISFLSILAGQPKLVFRMDRPDVTIIKDQQGKLNVLGLMKEVPPTEEPAPEAEQPTGQIPMLGMIAASGIDVELINAQIQFKDLASGFSQDVQDLNVQLSDISMSRPMTLKVWADIETQVADIVSLKGPFQVNGTMMPEFDGLSFSQVGIDMTLNFDDIAIDMGSTFQKPAGLPTNVTLKMVASPDFVDVSNLLVKFHNAELKASAKITDLQQPSPRVEFDLKSQPIDLSEWGRLITALKGLELEGRMDLAATANGPLDQLKYTADVDIQDMLANAPGLQARPKMQIAVNVITNEIKLASLDFQAPGTDLAVRANLKNFSAPQVRVDVNSQAIDLDQLLPPPAEPAKGGADDGKAKPTKDKEGKKGGAPASTVATDIDQSLEPIRNSEFLKSVVANVAVRIGRFKGMKVEASQIEADFSFKDLVAGIDRLNLNVWQGLIKANANIDLKPATPLYRMNLNVNQIDVQTAVESQLESLRNTVVGRLSFKASGGGRSLNSDKILKNLDMSGSFKMDEAKFATIDVGTMVVEGINEALEDIKKKVPPLAEKKIKTPENFSSRYQEISSGFSLKNGAFSAPNFKTVSYENEGIDVEGKTNADLVNDKLDADWLVIDTYNVTKARNVSVNVNGVNIEHILAEGSKPVSFPVKVGCQLSAPCYQYDQVAKHLAEIALNNVRGAAKTRVKKEVKKLEKRAKKAVDKQKEKAAEEAKKKMQKEAEKLKERFGF